VNDKQRNLVAIVAVALAAAALYFSYTQHSKPEPVFPFPGDRMIHPFQPNSGCDEGQCRSPFAVQCPYCNRPLMVRPPAHPRRGDLPSGDLPAVEPKATS
jgi:hypothetical protein